MEYVLGEYTTYLLDNRYFKDEYNLTYRIMRTQIIESGVHWKNINYNEINKALRFLYDDFDIDVTNKLYMMGISDRFMNFIKSEIIGLDINDARDICTKYCISLKSVIGGTCELNLQRITVELDDSNKIISIIKFG